MRTRRDLANRPYVNNWYARSKADLGFPTVGPGEIHIIGIKHTVPVSGNVNENSTNRHIEVVARIGHEAHLLVAKRTGEFFGGKAGFRTFRRAIGYRLEGWHAGADYAA